MIFFAKFLVFGHFLVTIFVLSLSFGGGGPLFSFFLASFRGTEMFLARCRRESQSEFGAYRGLVRAGVWCVPGFGAGFEITLEASKLQKGERRRKCRKRALLFSAPSSGMHQTLVQKEI